ncbi:MAG TPA: hypothetical protein VGB98_24355 [Pyrinomonadaceae bacterium]|jgi:hypothetical protein
MSSETFTGIALVAVTLGCTAAALTLRRRSRWSIFFAFFAGYIASEALALLTR